MTGIPASASRTQLSTLAISVTAILLVAACLRSAITAVGPVLDQIGAEYRLSEFWLGVLGALPLIGFAVISPVVHLMSRRPGAEQTVLWAVLALTLGLVLRSTPGVWWLWLGTAGIGAAIAVINVLLPAIVKRDRAHRIPLVTGSYTAVMSGCAALASGVSAPIAAATGSWRWSLCCWAAVSLPAAMLWWRQCRRRAGGVRLARADAEVTPVTAERVPRARGVWRSPGAWHITAFMGLQSSCYFLVVTWLPSIEAARGGSVEATGWYLTIAQIAGILAGLAVTTVMGRRRDQRWVAVGCAIPALVGGLGIVVLPEGMVVWMTLVVMATGAALVVALALMGLRTRSHAQTGRLSGFAQSGGYAIAALSIVVAGAVGRLVGVTAVSWVVLAVSVLLLLVAPLAGRPDYVDGRP